MGVRITDKLPQFVKANFSAMDRSLNRMAVDIERLSKERVPFLKGQLKASGRHRKAGLLDYKVEYNTVYARFQEFGGDARRVVKKYSYPGKQAHYLRDSGNEIARKAINYFMEEARSIKV